MDTNDKKNIIMETITLKEAARKYAESQFDKENGNEIAYTNSVEDATRDFEAGANWAAAHPHASFDEVDAAAKAYAHEMEESDYAEDIETSFNEGVEWYQVEISKLWTRKAVNVDGNEAYQIEIKQTWSQKVIDFLFHRTFIGWCTIGMIVILLFLYIVLN